MSHGAADPPYESPPSPRVRWLALLLGAAAFGLVAFVPSALHRVPGFGARPAYAAATAALMAVFWLTEALPIAWTACLPLVLFPAFGVFGRGIARDAAAASLPFADAYIFLFLGGMVLGAAIEQWKLHRRIALNVMLRIGTDPKRLLLGVLVATASVSLWISNTATAVMMLPIATALVSELEATKGRRVAAYGTAVLLAVAYGSNVGGIGTKIGTGTNSIFAGVATSRLHMEIGFLDYVLLAFPFVVLFLPVLWLALWLVGRHDAPDAGSSGDLVSRELARLGPLSKKERLVLAVFAFAAALWVAEDLLKAPFARGVRSLLGVATQVKHYEATVAMMAAALLALLRTLTWDALRRIPYGTLVLLGGSFALAAGVEGSGLSTWLGAELASIDRMPELYQLGAAALASVVLSAFASNTATINVLLTILPARFPLFAAAAIGASCDFMLPAGTPPNAIVFGSGRVRLATMIRVGFVLDALAVVSITAYAYLYLR